jgi:hypothetical protein
MPDPAPPTSLVALRDRREQVISALTEHYAADLFDVDELDKRIDLAHRARSIAELEEIVVDLAPLPAPTTALATRTTGLVVADDPSRPEKRRMFAIMGGFDKKGRWRVPRFLRIICFWGGGSLDFREADFAPGVTEVRITAVMGGVEIIVPPNLAVECDASAIMGGFEEMDRGHGEPDPGRAVLRITGLAVMGGVSIETRLPGETNRDARKRIKRERKQLAAGHARSLPPGSDS